MAVGGALVRCQVAIALWAAWTAAGCTMPQRHAMRIREKSRSFEVCGTARVSERKNAWGEDAGEALAREAARRDAEAQTNRRIVFGAFHLSGDKLDLRSVPPPRYGTLVIEEKRQAGMYLVTREVLVPEAAFGHGENWIAMSVHHEEELGGNSTQTQSHVEALKAFLRATAAARYGKEPPQDLSGEVRAIIERSETLSNRRRVDVWGTALFR